MVEGILGRNTGFWEILRDFCQILANFGHKNAPSLSDGAEG